MKTSLAWRALLPAAVFASTALAAFQAGHTAYTKRHETKLLAEPKPLAEAAGTLPAGRAVTVEQVQGAWVRVREGDAGGWVFQGNLTATKPVEVTGVLDGAPLAASETTATAAARPLATAANDYAAARDFGSAREDLEWLIEQCAALPDEEVTAYLQAQKKGEFQ
jgi:hypothetical protein